MFVLALLLSIFTLMGTSFGATYHVDRDRNCPGSGSSNAPYCWLTALQQNRSLQCGDMIFIHASSGKYNETVTFESPNCTGSARVTITKAPGGAKPTFTSTLRSGASVGVITLRDVSGWTIEHLRFSDTSGLQNPKFAIQVLGGRQSISNITLRYLEVDTFALNTTHADPVALYVGGSVTHGPARNVVIEDNTIRNFRGTGIELRAAVGGRVS